MKFSVFHEMQISGPTRESEQQTFRDCAAQAVFADELGYHCVWEVEHHGLYEYSHSSAPEVFLSFVAARTKQIRLGHGVTLTPYRYNHPIRIAERIATLDILSEGRVNWGSGKSSSRVEQDAFENDVALLDDQWLEALLMIPRMWQTEVFEWSGRFFIIPPTRIIPKPLQQPHPPIFAACSRPESVASMGALGVGALNFAVGSLDSLIQKVEGYKRAVAASHPEGRQKNDHFACAPATLVLEDDKKARSYGFRGARCFAEGLARYYFADSSVPGPLGVPSDFLSPNNTIIGDPVAARETVSSFQKAGVDELILVMQMGTVPHELTMQSLRTFAEKVMPHFG